MSNLWKKITDIELSSVSHLDANDICYYARDYIPNQGFQGGETNDLVLNFKKAPNTNGQSYRAYAIKKFAQEASILFDCNAHTSIAVTAIPSSKAVNDPLYDKRFEDLFAELSALRPCINIQWPITAIDTVQASHQGGARSPAVIINNYFWQGFSGGLPEFILVFDDVLTSGAHFKAYKDLLIQNGYTGSVFGIFWAKSQ